MLYSRDEIAVKELKAGSILAFNSLFAEYSGRLYGFGLKYMQSKADAEELVQNVFLKIWKNRESLDVTKSFKGYLFTIAFNEIRKHFQDRIVTCRLDDFAMQPIGHDSTQEELAYNATLARIYGLLDNLTARQRQIFEMSRFEHLSSKDIACRLNISPKTVDNQVSEVIHYLRGFMKEV